MPRGASIVNSTSVTAYHGSPSLLEYRWVCCAVFSSSKDGCGSWLSSTSVGALLALQGSCLVAAAHQPQPAARRCLNTGAAGAGVGPTLGCSAPGPL
jgi:hypothetical protein